MNLIIASGVVGLLTIIPLEDKPAESTQRHALETIETQTRYQSFNLDTNELELIQIRGRTIYNITTGEFKTIRAR